MRTDRFSGAVTDHELLSIEVDPPVLPIEVEAQRSSRVAREGAVTFTMTDGLLLQACAVAVERELQRIVWPGLDSHARTHVNGARYRARSGLRGAVLRALPGDVHSGAHVRQAVERRCSGLDDAGGKHDDQQWLPQRSRLSHPRGRGWAV